MSLDRELLARMDEDTLAWFGKRVMDCNGVEIAEAVKRTEARLAGIGADLDQCQMVAREIDVCGCTVRVPIREDGTPDVARGVPLHTCGRGQ